MKRFFRNDGCLGAGVETLFSAGTLLLFLSFARAGVTINSVLMILTGALNCGADIILCKSKSKQKTKRNSYESNCTTHSCLGSSVPFEIGEMDGRNAGSAVIGFVNGEFHKFFSSSSSRSIRK